MKKLILVFIILFISFSFVFLREVRIFSKSNTALNDDHKNSSAAADNADCSDGWRITGYFTPIEAEYTSPETREIEIKGAGRMTFNSEFLRVVFDENAGYGEGWGKTRFGWYLGNYNGAWHKADAPLDADNSPLRTNSVAVDQSLIPTDSIVKIPGLPGAFGSETFIANDVGVTVHGKHIDVYTGEGKDAGREMYRITFEDDDELQRVCFQKPK